MPRSLPASSLVLHRPRRHLIADVLHHASDRRRVHRVGHSRYRDEPLFALARRKASRMRSKRPLEHLSLLRAPVPGVALDAAAPSVGHRGLDDGELDSWRRRARGRAPGGADQEAERGSHRGAPHRWPAFGSRGRATGFFSHASRSAADELSFRSRKIFRAWPAWASAAFFWPGTPTSVIARSRWR